MRPPSQAESTLPSFLNAPLFRAEASRGATRAWSRPASQSGHGLSVWECSLLDVLSRRHDGEGGRLQMKQVADAVVTDVSDAGLRHLAEARPTNDAALHEALKEVARNPTDPSGPRRGGR
jgi:hypothetical protein